MATTRHSQKTKLDFTEAIIQKGAGTDALLKRLKTLSGKLAVLEQDHVDVKSLNNVRKQLIDDVVLHHKDKGVKAYAAVCIADILRLYAPEAPYTADEIRDIFMFFIEQLSRGLKPARPAKAKATDASAAGGSQSQLPGGRITELPYYDQYCRLLESLATVKSVVLICDLPGADELITSYFDKFVELVRPDMSKNIVRHMADILVTVIEESEGAVPSGVMDCVIDQFENHAAAPETPSFQLIVEVCNQTADKLQRAVFAHVSEIQMEHARNPDQEDFKALSDSHKLCLTIFRYAPALLLNVVPLLEENLRAADEVPLRQLSTRTLGTMFGERPVVSAGMFDVARSFPHTWRAWLGRKVDKALSVRLAWVESCRGILENHPEIRRELETELVDRTEDADERVRAAICKTIGQLDYATALHHVSADLLRAIGARMSDKKSSVHTEAIAALAKLWSMAYSEIDAEAVEQFAWIPEAMLHASRRASPELRSHLVAAIKLSILPLPERADDEQAWMDRFLLVAGYADESALEALDSMTGLMGYARGSSPWKAFADTLEDYNGGIVEKEKEHIKARLAFIVEAVATTFFPDADKAKKDLQTFASNNDRKLFGLLRRVADPQSDLQAIIKARNEFLRKVEQSYTSLLGTAKQLVDQAAWNIINHSAIPPLIKRLQRPEGPQAERSAALAKRYLALVAKECTPMYKSHVPELVIAVNDKRREALVEVALQALAAVAKWDSGSAPKDEKTAARALQVIQSGTPRQAKFAARFVAFSQKAAQKSTHESSQQSSSRSTNESRPVEQLVETIWKALDKARASQKPKETEALLPLLRACSELALSAPAEFKTRSVDIIDFVRKRVLYAPSPDTALDENDADVSMDDDKWTDEATLPVIDRAKIIGLRLLTHVALSHAREMDAAELAAPTIGLLLDVLRNKGQVLGEHGEVEHGPTNEGTQLRLRAALCLLKLAHVRVYDKAMNAGFPIVHEVVMDTNYTVRHRFLRKLALVLPPQRLLPKWNVLPMLVAQDPEAENLDLTIIAFNVKSCERLSSAERIDRVELPLARMLHALALDHDLDFDSLGSIRTIAHFIEVFLDIAATRDNVSLLFNIASKLKTVKIRGAAEREGTQEPRRPDEDEMAEPVPQASSQRLYMMAELAQVMIRNRAAQHSWPVATYPGKVKLQADIFDNLVQPQAVQQVMHTQYLAPEVLDAIKGLGGKRAGAPRRERAHVEPAERKRRPRAEGGTRKRRRTSRASKSDEGSDDDDEDSDDEDSDEDEEGDEDGSGGEGGEGDEDEVEAVVGRRNERRSAKTKANKAVMKKSRKGRK